MTSQLPDAEELAKMYREAIKSNHAGRAEMAREAMANVAVAEAASVEAMMLKSFADKIS